GRRDLLRLLKRPFHAALHNTLCARRLLSEPRDKTRAATPTRPARHLREPGELPLGSAGGPIQLPHPRPRIRIQHDRELFYRGHPSHPYRFRIVPPNRRVNSSSRFLCSCGVCAGRLLRPHLVTKSSTRHRRRSLPLWSMLVIRSAKSPTRMSSRG